jgi:hypothetical protein
MGFVLPVLPPRALLADSLFPLEDYFNKVLELEKVRWLRTRLFHIYPCWLGRDPKLRPSAVALPLKSDDVTSWTGPA